MTLIFEIGIPVFRIDAENSLKTNTLLLDNYLSNYIAEI